MRDGRDGLLSSIGTGLKKQLQIHYRTDDLRGIPIERIASDLPRINAYVNWDDLDLDIQSEDISTVPQNVPSADMRAVLEMFERSGSLTRHDAAGEATRLGLGTKWLLAPQELADVLLKVEAHTKTISYGVRGLTVEQNEKLDRSIAGLPSETVQRMMAGLEKLRAQGVIGPQGQAMLQNINFGDRHMLQHSFRLRNIGATNGIDGSIMTEKHSNFVILNEETANLIISDHFLRRKFFGFSQDNTYFMVQDSYHGWAISPSGTVYLDEASPLRLYNHGAMAMQTTMDNQVFRINGEGKEYLSGTDVDEMTRSCQHMIAYNIEDYDFLSSNPDYPGLAVALKLGRQGYRMVMEIVSQKVPPQDGGFLSWDRALNRRIIVESDQVPMAKGSPERFGFLSGIKCLNKNFNQFLYPAEFMRALRSYGLPVHLSVKDGYMYPQPPQGDINFIVPTAFVKREVLMPIGSLKELADIPATLLGFLKQDQQPGFREHSEGLGF
jgi:hypothetical protein